MDVEFIIAIIAIVCVGIISYFVYNLSLDSKQQFNEYAPELNYQFPAVFVHSFLMTKIEKKDLLELNLDENQTFFVKDLIAINTEESEAIVNKIRENYLQKYAYLQDTQDLSPVDYYQRFSSDEINKDKLLLIYYDDIEQYSNLDASIRRNNYFFYLKTNNDNKKAYIKFKQY